MSTSETDSPQSESPACDQQPDVGTVCTDGFDLHDGSKGYSTAEGAPKRPTRAEWERFLMEESVSIEDACRIKWGWGVQEHREGDASKPFSGDSLTEVHSEGLDSLNYLPMTMAEWGHVPGVHECLEEMQGGAFKLVRGGRRVREIIDEWLRAQSTEG